VVHLQPGVRWLVRQYVLKGLSFPLRRKHPDADTTLTKASP